MLSLLGLFRACAPALIFSIFILQTEFAAAACSWSGASVIRSSEDGPLVFESSGYKILANKVWFQSPDYIDGTEVKMGVDVLALSTQTCNQLGNMASQFVTAVYHPPAGQNVRRVQNGYRIPSTAQGVEFEISFPNGTQNFSDGYIVGQSSGRVSGTTLTTRNGISLAVAISIIKTGKFSEGHLEGSNLIRAESGLGSFQYYRTDDMSVVSVVSNQLLMPDTYFGSDVSGGFVGSASSPWCDVVAIGNMPLDSGTRVITLPAVSTLDFSGPGAIDKNAQAGQFRFKCVGTQETQPKVYFDATYPFQNGNNGVGMPSDGSDVGVQILLNGVAVQFGSSGRSSALRWDRQPFPSMTAESYLGYGEIPAEGFYCIIDCGVDMDGDNWIGGGAGEGNNNGETDAEITFKYYQTTNRAPQPRAFSVPFTVTLDIQ